MGKYIPKSDTSRHESPTVDVNYSALFLQFYCSYLWYTSVVPEWGSCCYFQTSDWPFGYVNQSDLLLLHRSSTFIRSILSTGEHTEQAGMPHVVTAITFCKISIHSIPTLQGFSGPPTEPSFPVHQGSFLTWFLFTCWGDLLFLSGIQIPLHAKQCVWLLQIFLPSKNTVGSNTIITGCSQ